MAERRSASALTLPPWMVQPMTNGYRVLGGPVARVVAEVPARREKDAVLIASAPDLLAACRLGDGLGNEGPYLLEYAADLLEPFAPPTANELRRKARAEAEAIGAATDGGASNA